MSPLIALLERYMPLEPAERQALQELANQPRRFPAGADLVLEGDRPKEARLLLSGQAFRHKTLADGRRQIMSFHVPGELLDVQGLFMTMDHSVCALTPCEAAVIPHPKLVAMFEAHPRLALAFWRMNLVEGAVFREWMLGIGRRDAYARVAHLFCEVLIRLRAAGLSDGARAAFPVTQQHLSDALGLSAVHTNRVLQQLRGQGLLSFSGGELVVMDWAGLQAAGEFDPAYLHLSEAN
ncbi:Crp/Fnr family transcriptional regulator [Phenylobacterium deserti]|uniref:Crp/Fnr family transcriptional regulator n=1 Tax=Phenylobacterium deserti TaxID=1914756 RepID=UPI001401F647|nr:Crp/Fnr family transcriptional regulator [Phenylobacterium deserti]